MAPKIGGRALMEDLFIIVELKEKSFEKYIKARSDVERPGWFKCSNRLIEDDELFVLTASETCAWIYIMSQASLQQSQRVRLNWDKVDSFRRRFTRDDLKSTIEKLRALGILKKDVTSTLRGRNEDGTLGEDGIGEDLKAGVVQDTAREEPAPEPPPPAVSKFTGPVHPELAGNSKRDQVLSTIPLDLQQEWVSKYDQSWLKSALLKAIANYTKEDPVALVTDWESKLIHWFHIEKKAKLRKPPAAESSRAPPSPHDPESRARAFQANPELEERRRKLGLKTANSN